MMDLNKLKKFTLRNLVSEKAKNEARTRNKRVKNFKTEVEKITKAKGIIKDFSGFAVGSEKMNDAVVAHRYYFLSGKMGKTDGSEKAKKIKKAWQDGVEQPILKYNSNPEVVIDFDGHEKICEDLYLILDPLKIENIPQVMLDAEAFLIRGGVDDEEVKMIREEIERGEQVFKRLNKMTEELVKSQAGCNGMITKLAMAFDAANSDEIDVNDSYDGDERLELIRTLKTTNEVGKKPIDAYKDKKRENNETIASLRAGIIENNKLISRLLKNTARSGFSFSKKEFLKFVSYILKHINLLCGYIYEFIFTGVINPKLSISVDKILKWLKVINEAISSTQTIDRAKFFKLALAMIITASGYRLQRRSFDLRDAKAEFEKGSAEILAAANKELARLNTDGLVIQNDKQGTNFFTNLYMLSVIVNNANLMIEQFNQMRKVLNEIEKTLKNFVDVLNGKSKIKKLLTLGNFLLAGAVCIFFCFPEPYALALVALASVFLLIVQIADFLKS